MSPSRSRSTLRLRALRRVRPLNLATAATLGFALALAGPVLSSAAVLRGANAPAAVPPAWDRAPGGGWTGALQTPEAIRWEGAASVTWILASIALVVLAAAALNLVTLRVARGGEMRGGNAVRAALGASPARLARAAALEGARTGVAGGAVGAMLGMATGTLLARTWPGEPVPWLSPGAGTDVLLLFAAAAVAATLLVGMLATPVLFRRGLHAHLTTGTRSTPAPGEGFLRRALTVLQFGASVALLTTAAVMVRGTLPQGAAATYTADPSDTLTFRVAVPGEAGARAAATRQAVERIGALPGVLAVSASTPGAWLGIGPQDDVVTICPRCRGGGLGLPILFGHPRHQVVTPGFFEALGVPVVRGREFASDEPADAPRPLVVNEVFANRLLPGVDPLGQRVNLSRRWLGEESYVVVGVVGDLRAPGPGNEGEPMPAVYLAADAHPPRALDFAVRTAGDPLAHEDAVHAALAAVDPRLAPTGFSTLEAVLARHHAPLRWFAAVLVALGLGAVALAAGGLYGVMRHSVVRRTRELGIRVALGGAPRHVLRQVLGEGMRLAAIGAVVGLAGAVTLGRLLQLLFSGVRPFDAFAYAAAALLLAATAVAAAWLPARLATRADPMEALRAE